MASSNRNYVDDNGRILRDEPYHQQQHPQHPIVEWEDDFEDDDPEFSTYFSDQKVEIPSFPDDEKVQKILFLMSIVTGTLKYIKLYYMLKIIILM